MAGVMEKKKSKKWAWEVRDSKEERNVKKSIWNKHTTRPLWQRAWQGKGISLEKARGSCIFLPHGPQMVMCSLFFTAKQMVMCSLSYTAKEMGVCSLSYTAKQKTVCSLSQTVRWLCVHFPRLSEDCVHFPRLSEDCVFTFLDSQKIVCSLS